MLSDPIKAAMITGSIQAVSATATIIAAWVGFRSWRRNTLGNRQIELAEECLLLLWTFDNIIKTARQILIPVSPEEFLHNQKYKAIYVENHKKAWERIRESSQALEMFKNKFLIAQFYLGIFPHVKFDGETRLFRVDYPIAFEYDEIFGAFCTLLMETSPQAVEEALSKSSDWGKLEKSSNLFYGLASDYEEDEYSIRLRLTKQIFERHIKKRLRQTSILAQVRA